MIETNEYFNGQVKSLTVNNSENRSTIGAISSGEYQFSTSSIEIMTIISGSLWVQLPNSTTWKKFEKGEKFEIASFSNFKVKAEETVAYFCVYIN